MGALDDESAIAGKEVDWDYDLVGARWLELHATYNELPQYSRTSRSYSWSYFEGGGTNEVVEG